MIPTSQNAIEVLQAEVKKLQRNFDRHSRLAVTHTAKAQKYHEALSEDHRQIMVCLNVLVETSEVVQSKLPPRTSRKPNEMIKLEYRGRKLVEVIKEVFTQQGSPWNINDLVPVIYEAGTKQEFKNCKTSLTATLSRAVRQGLLIRVEEGTFALSEQRCSPTNTYTGGPKN